MRSVKVSTLSLSLFFFFLRSTSRDREIKIDMYINTFQSTFPCNFFSLNIFRAFLACVYTTELLWRPLSVRRPPVHCPLTRVSWKALYRSRPNIMDSYISTVSPDLCSASKFLKVFFFCSFSLTWHWDPSGRKILKRYPCPSFHPI